MIAPSLARFLDEHRVALAPEIEAERGEALGATSDADVATHPRRADAWGRTPPAVFRALAAVLPGTSPAAAELVEASLLLAPERRMTHLTRALIRVQRGDEAGARADAAVVEADSPGAAAVAALVHAAWCSAVRLLARRARALARDADSGDMPVAVGQSLEAIRHARRRLRHPPRAPRATPCARSLGDSGASAEPAWLPPDVSRAVAERSR